MNAVASLGGTLAILAIATAIIALLPRSSVSGRWVAIAAALVALNDAALTSAFHLIPPLLPAGQPNWQGKLAALAASLAIAALPAFGWRRCALTTTQADGSLRVALPVAALYCGTFVALGLMSPNDEYTAGDLAFQLALPGLEEEVFYRGVLLYALDRAFTGRWRALGVDWGWGAVLSCGLFGIVHALAFADGAFSFDTPIMMMTGLLSFIAVWLRYRTGSLILPIVIHVTGNVAMMTL